MPFAAICVGQCLVEFVAAGSGEGAVLDAIDAGFGGDADAFDAVGVGGDLAAKAVRFFDAGAKLIDGELRRRRCSCGGSYCRRWPSP